MLSLLVSPFCVACSNIFLCLCLRTGADFNTYMEFCRYGIVLKKLDLLNESTSVLCEAIAAEPMLWCAWLELAYLVSSKEMVSNRALYGRNLHSPLFVFLTL